MSEKTKIETPCPKCGGDRYFLYTYPKHRVKMCLDCNDNRRPMHGKGQKPGKQELPVAQMKQIEVAQALGTGLSVEKAAIQTHQKESYVQRVRQRMKTDDLLLEAFKRAQEDAAIKVLPLAQRAAIMGLERGIDAMENGIDQSVGFNKETGLPVMAKIKPNLQQLSTFVRDTSYLIGVGKGGIISTDQDEQHHEIQKSVVDKLNWNDPAVLEAAMKIAAGIAHDRAPALAISARREDD